VSHDFDDVDELGEVANDWDIDFRQLNRGSFRGQFFQVGSKVLQVARARLRGIVHQQGVSPGGLVTFAASRNRDIDLTWRGSTVGRDELLVYRPADELECISRTDFDILVVSVSEEALERSSRRRDLSVAGTSMADIEIARCDAASLQALRRWMVGFLAAISQDTSALTDPGIVRANENLACDLITRCFTSTLTSHRRVRSTRNRRLVEDAVRLARNHAHDLTSVDDLCRKSGASQRTLRRGFQERFGVSPKAYLQAQRLIGARRRLRLSGGNIPITDIANAWSFWHMGQFAADYRRQFGELPAETLKRVAVPG